MRERAQRHRQYVTGDRSRTSPLAVLIAIGSILFLATMIYLGMVRVRPQSHAIAVMEPTPGLPILLVNDGVDMNSPRLRSRLQRTIQERRDKGYNVILDPVLELQLRPSVLAWRTRPDSGTDQAIENLLEQNDLFGVLHVRATRSNRDVEETLIRSTRSEATKRRGPIGDSILSALLMSVPPTEPYLLLNDHPAKVDPQVEQQIEKLVSQLQARGWSLMVNDDVEVQARKMLPPPAAGNMQQPLTMSPMLDALLQEQKLGGILRIEARAGASDGAAGDRVAIARIDRGNRQ